VNAPDLSDRLADIRAEFAERGITPTPLAVIAHAFDAGFDETTAVALAEMIRQQECPPGAQGQLGSKPWQ
jgi:hypothetical protein